jgi:alpha-D-ribose 1-methylphosphonate 5-triphosphate diphosphatase PhnM
MMKLTNWLMLSCKKATELMEKQSLVGLSTKEKLRLRMHTTMCDGCTAYQKQSLLIDNLLHHHFDDTLPNVVPEVENTELRDRILLNLPKN